MEAAQLHADAISLTEWDHAIENLKAGLAVSRNKK